MRKKIKVNKLAILMILLFIGILSMGASSWLIIDERSGSPSYQSPISIELKSTNFYEDETKSIFTDISSYTITDSNNEAITEGTVTLLNANEIVFGAQQTETTTVDVKIEFEPKNSKYGKVRKTFENVTLHAVAHDGAGTKTYFGNLEYAINNTRTKDVYVIPKLPEIAGGTYEDGKPYSVSLYSESGTISVPSGNQLVLPYEGTTYKNRAGTTNNPIMVTNVLLKSNLNLNGTLCVGGVLGVENEYEKQGFTSGAYAQIMMKQGTKINSAGSIDCLGFIKEENEGTAFVEATSGVVYSPFVVYDYGAPAHTIGAYYEPNNPPVAPFAVYDLPNIQAVFTCKYGAELYGYADMYTRTEVPQELLDMPVVGVLVEGILGGTSIEQHNTTEALIIGKTGGLIILKEGGYIVADYNPSSKKPSEPAGYTNLKIYGNVEVGSLSLELSVLTFTKAIESSNLLFPISYKYAIEVYGTVNVSNKLKFLPGSSLIIQEGGTLNVNKELVFYEEFNCPKAPGVGKYPISTNNPAVFEVNGTVNINSNFGGKITANSNTGKVIVQNGINTSITVVEKRGSFNLSADNLVAIAEIFKSGASDSSISALSVATKTETVTNSMQLPRYGSETPYSETGKSYYSLPTENGYAWVTSDNEFAVNYVLNLDGASNSDNNPQIFTPESSIELDILESTSGYRFAGWYADSEFTHQVFALNSDALQYVKEGTLTLYAKWSEAYEISFVSGKTQLNVSSYKGFADESGFFNPYDLTQTTMKDVVNVLDNHDSDTSKDYYFSGKWYTDSALQNEIPATGFVLSGDTTIYAGWGDKYDLTVVAKSTPNSNNGAIAIDINETIHLNENQISSILSEYTSKAKALDNNRLTSKYFTKWTDNSGNEIIMLSVTSFIEKKLTITANWANKAKIIGSVTGGRLIINLSASVTISTGDGNDDIVVSQSGQTTKTIESQYGDIYVKPGCTITVTTGNKISVFMADNTNVTTPYTVQKGVEVINIQVTYL